VIVIRRLVNRRAVRLALAGALLLAGGMTALADGQRAPRNAAAKERANPNHPGNDPNHPLKDPAKDPGPNPGQVPEEQRKSDGTPAIGYADGNWPWGELLYGKTYPTTLTITNKCKTPETVGIFVTGLPYISLPPTATVPAEGELELPINIVTPPKPNILLTGHETLPEHGIFGEIEGEIVIWHPWRFNPDCLPKRESYKASGHIHFDVTPPPAPPVPEKIAGAGPCQVWWNTGARPATLKEDQDCIAEIRNLAATYRLRVLQPLVDRAPSEWGWLPSAEQIAQMSIEECLGMKAKAQAQLEKQR
jgi:hypothetical protein